MTGDDEGSYSPPGEEQREMMEILSQETRHSVIMAILGHPHHLPSRTEIEEMVSKSTGAIDDAVERLEQEGLIQRYDIEDPDNPNNRDYPTRFLGPTPHGIRIFHEYNYLRLVPAQRALYDSSVLTDTMERHLEADRPSLPKEIQEALEFDDPTVEEHEENESEPLFSGDGSATTVSNQSNQDPDHKQTQTGLSGLVKSALEEDENEKQWWAEPRTEYSEDPRIVIVGAGGAGNNTVNRMYNIGVDGAEIVAIDSDRQHLETIEADTKILVGAHLTDGLGTGGDPSKGERATEMAQSTIKEVLGEADLVFVTAGMGGGTGTGAAPVVSKIAKEQGAIVVGMVSIPFNIEGERTVKAEEGLAKMRNEADSIIVLDNNLMLDYLPNLPVSEAFSVIDQIIAETVKGISETITQPSLINLDYADMSAIMNEGGVAVMLVGGAQNKNQTEEVVMDAMVHPLLNVDYSSASGGLVHITGGPDLTLKQAESIAQNITDRLEADANVIWGAQIQEEYKEQVQVIAILTGIQSAQILGPTAQKQANKSKQAIDTSGGNFERLFNSDERVPSVDPESQNTGDFTHGLDIGEQLEEIAQSIEVSEHELRQLSGDPEIHEVFDKLQSIESDIVSLDEFLDNNKKSEEKSKDSD